MGEILLDLGKLTKEQLDRVLHRKESSAQHVNGTAVDMEHTLTGDLAIDLGFCSHEDVEEALDIQKQEGSPQLLRERIREATTELNDHTQSMRAVGNWAGAQLKK